MKYGHIILLAIVIIIGGYGTYYFSAMQTTHNVYLNILGIQDDNAYSYKIEPGRGLSDCMICPKNIPSALQGSNVALSFTVDNKIPHDSVMDLNIDAFNIHVNETALSATKHVEFVADKIGTFTIYSRSHPEMNSTIVIVPNFLPWF